MKAYEIEILHAILSLEEEIQTALLEAYKKALKETCYKIKLLALSEIMEKLWVEQPEGMNPAYYCVYQQKYEREIDKTIQEPFIDLEKRERDIINNGLRKYYIIGALSVLYCLHKQNVPLIMPEFSSQGEQKLTVTLSYPHVADWYKYQAKNLQSLRANIVREVQRQISNGVPYNQIARNMAKYMEKNYNTPYKRAYSKAMTIVRTEGGRILNEAQYKTMLEAKKNGADIKKQWCAVLDQKTRPTHAAVNGEIREIEEPFSNGLLYPCQSGKAAEEVINCRCTAFARITEKPVYGNEKDRAGYYRIDDTESFEQMIQRGIKTMGSTKQS